MAIFTRRGDVRVVAVAFLGYFGLAHIYAYAYQAHWLGPVGVLSHHFLVLSCWPFIAIFAANAIFEPFRLLTLQPGTAAIISERQKLAQLVLTIGVGAHLVAIIVGLLRKSLWGRTLSNGAVARRCRGIRRPAAGADGASVLSQQDASRQAPGRCRQRA